MGTTTINDRSEKKIIKIVPLCQHTCGASNLKNKMCQAAPYSNISKRCLLSLHEKLANTLYPNCEELLNKKSEKISKHCHLNKFLLMNFNSNS